MKVKNKWEKIVERGSILLPSFELSRGAGELFSVVDGEIDYDQVVGHMPNTYYDKSYADFHYYSFTAWCPDPDEIGVFCYCRFDEDEGTYDDGGFFVEIEPEKFDVFLTYQTEEEFLKEREAE